MNGFKLGALAAVAWSASGASESLAQRVAPVAAQPVAVGSRVRISAPTLRRERYTGRVESIDASEVTLVTAGVRRRLGFEMGPVVVESDPSRPVAPGTLVGIALDGRRAHVFDREGTAWPMAA